MEILTELEHDQDHVYAQLTSFVSAAGTAEMVEVDSTELLGKTDQMELDIVDLDLADPSLGIIQLSDSTSLEPKQEEPHLAVRASGEEERVSANAGEENPPHETAGDMSDQVRQTSPEQSEDNSPSLSADNKVVSNQEAAEPAVVMPPTEGSLMPSTEAQEPKVQIGQADGVELTCGICQQCVLGAAELLQHYQSCHLPAGAQHWYECSHCSDCYRSSIAAKRHARRCKQGRLAAFIEEKLLYLCAQCLKGFTDQSSLAAHLGSHAEGVISGALATQSSGESSGPQKCTNGSSSNNENIEPNNLSSIGNEKHSGRTLVFAKNNNKSAKIARSLTLSKTKSKKEPVQCEKCNQSFTSKSKVQHHLRERHQEYLCALCHVKFNTLHEFKGHISRDHPDSKEDIFQCLKCPQTFGSHHSLTAHSRWHDNPHNFPCPKCDRVFTHRHALRDHIRIHTGEKPFLCSVCGKTFRIHNDLLKHQYTHSDFRPHVCHFCQKAFTNFTALKRHLRKHTGEKPYSCDVCEKKFSCKSDLNKHVRIHSGERPFVCMLCGKSFAWAKCLVKHARVHSDARPNVCQICGKSFKWPYTLQKHIKSHQNGHEPVRNKKSYSQQLSRSAQKADVGSKVMIPRRQPRGQSDGRSMVKPLQVENSGASLIQLDQGAAHNLIHIFLPDQNISAEQLEPYLTGPGPQVMLVNQDISMPDMDPSNPPYLTSTSSVGLTSLLAPPPTDQVTYIEEASSSEVTYVEQASASLSLLQPASGTNSSSQPDLTSLVSTQQLHEDFLQTTNHASVGGSIMPHVFQVENEKGAIYVLKVPSDVV